MKQMKSKIRDLLNEFYDELEQRGYSQNSKWSYGKICRDLAAWCGNNGIESFDEAVAIRFCDETINGHLSNVNESHHYRHTLRVVRMLVTLQKDGDFEFRAPRTEYVFRTILKQFINPYLDECSDKRRLSLASIAERRLVLYRFDCFLYENNIEYENLTSDLFESFFSSSMCPQRSRRSYKSILREFYRYTYDYGVLSKDYSTFILKEPKVPQEIKLPTTYTEDEIRKMLESVNRSSAKGKRDYLVLLLAAEYGWRASDITSYNLGQINWGKNKILMIQYKTGVPIEFPLLASIGNATIDYLKHGRPSGGDDVIIVSHENKHKGKKLSSPTIHSIVTSAMRSANISNWKEKKHGPHSLRHSLATNMLKQNISIPIISTILGHQSTEVTKVYISVDFEKLRQCSLPIPEINSPYYKILKED